MTDGSNRYESDFVDESPEPVEGEGETGRERGMGTYELIRAQRTIEIQ